MLLERLKFILSELEGNTAWGVEGRKVLLFKRYILIKVVLAVLNIGLQKSSVSKNNTNLKIKMC